jgi:hypothetical protein
MISDPNILIYEFLAIQLILRSVGFKTTEMEVSLLQVKPTATTISLELNQNGLCDSLEIGTLKLSLVKVQQFWEEWLAKATKDLHKNIVRYKEKLKAFRTMETMLEHLEKVGYNLTDVPINNTFDV